MITNTFVFNGSLAVCTHSHSPCDIVLTKESDTLNWSSHGDVIVDNECLQAEIVISTEENEEDSEVQPGLKGHLCSHVKFSPMRTRHTAISPPYKLHRS